MPQVMFTHSLVVFFCVVLPFVNKVLILWPREWRKIQLTGGWVEITLVWRTTKQEYFPLSKEDFKIQ